MTTKKKPLPKRHLHIEKAIFELISTKGVSKTICINKLGLPANYFNSYVGTDDNFNSVMATFTSDVLMESVTNNLGMDGASRKYLMQKLSQIGLGVVPLQHLLDKYIDGNMGYDFGVVRAQRPTF